MLEKTNQRMANPGKLATLGTQDKNKQNKKTTTHYVLDTTISQQLQIM